MKIKLRKGSCQTLAKKFGVSVQTISHAMNFRGKSMMEMRIRHYAMNELHGIIT